MQTTKKRALKGDDEEDARTEGIFEEELEDRKTRAKRHHRGAGPSRSGEEKRQ